MCEPFIRGLYSLSVSTLERTRLTDPGVRFGGDVDPKFSPNGRHIAFSRIFGLGGADLFVLDLEDANERRLTTDHRYVIGMEWMPGGRSLLFSSERDGTYDLWQIAASGGRPVWFPATGRNLKDPSIAEDGVMVYEDWSYDDNLWRVSLAGDSTENNPVRLLGSTLREIQPAYSTDGSRLAFVSNRSGDYEIWLANRDGSGELQLTRTGSPIVGSPGWSHDDRTIAFEIWRDGHADLYTVDVETRRVERLTDDPSDDILAAWSPDDRLLTFTSNRSGRWEIWVMDLAGGDARQVTSNGGYRSQFDPASGAIFHSDPEARGLFRVSVDPGHGISSLIVPDLESGDWGNWHAASDGIYYVVRRPSSGIALYDPGADSARMLVEMDRPPAPGRPGFAVDPQGRDAVFSKLDQTESDLVLMRIAG